MVEVERKRCEESGMESRSNDLDVFSELSSSARHALARESVRNDARESLSRSEPSRHETSARAREIEKKKKKFIRN